MEKTPLYFALASILIIAFILFLQTSAPTPIVKKTDQTCDAKNIRLEKLKCYVEKATETNDPAWCLKVISDPDLSTFCFAVIERTPENCYNIIDEGLEIECFRRLRTIPDPYKR